MKKDKKEKIEIASKPMLGAVSSLRRVCVNCMDFDSEKNLCTIRYLIHADKTKSPMPRKPNQRGCEVFMMK